VRFKATPAPIPVPANGDKTSTTKNATVKSSAAAVDSVLLANGLVTAVVTWLLFK
jgi:hypothetical protein